MIAFVLFVHRPPALLTVHGDDGLDDLARDDAVARMLVGFGESGHAALCGDRFSRARDPSARGVDDLPIHQVDAKRGFVPPTSKEPKLAPINRTGRDLGRLTDVPGGLSTPSLPRRGRRLLRMEKERRA